MASLGITEACVEEVLSSPDLVLSNGPGHPQDRLIYVGPTIRVVVGNSGTVITVGLNTRQPYRHGEHTLTNLPTRPNLPKAA